MGAVITQDIQGVEKFGEIGAEEAGARDCFLGSRCHFLSEFCPYLVRCCSIGLSLRKIRRTMHKMERDEGVVLPCFLERFLVSGPQETSVWAAFLALKRICVRFGVMVPCGDRLWFFRLNSTCLLSICCASCDRNGQPVISAPWCLAIVLVSQVM